MKLLIASGTWPPEISGQSYFCRNLYDSLKAKVEVLKVIAYTNKKTGHYGSAFLIKRTKLRYLTYFMRIFRQVEKVNIIYAQDLISSGLPSAMVKLFYPKVKLVIRLGGDFLWEKMINEHKIDIPLREYYHEPKSIRETLYIFIYRLVLYKADIIIFNTKKQADLYRQTFSLSLKKIQIVTNPIIASKDVSLPSVHRDVKIVLYAGRLVRVKNISLLIQAFKELPDDYELHIVGNGPEKTALEKLAFRDTRIHFKDGMPQEQLMEEIHKSYLVVIPSLTELGSNLVLESLAIGKPVLLTKENFFPDEIQKYFIMFNPRDKSDLRDKLLFFSKQTNYELYLKRLKSFNVKRDWTEVAKEHIRIFQKIV